MWDSRRWRPPTGGGFVGREVMNTSLRASLNARDVDRVQRPQPVPSVAERCWQDRSATLPGFPRSRCLKYYAQLAIAWGFVRGRDCAYDLGALRAASRRRHRFRTRSRAFLEIDKERTTLSGKALRGSAGTVKRRRTIFSRRPPPPRGQIHDDMASQNRPSSLHRNAIFSSASKTSGSHRSRFELRLRHR